MNYSFKYLLEKLEDKGYDIWSQKMFLSLYHLDDRSTDLSNYELRMLEPISSEHVQKIEAERRVTKWENLKKAHTHIDFSGCVRNNQPYCRHENVSMITKTLAFTPSYQFHSVHIGKTDNMITAFYEGFCPDCKKMLKAQIPDVYGLRWEISSDPANNIN